VLGRIGAEPRDGEAAAVALLRPALLDRLGSQGADPEVRQLAARLMREYLQDPTAVAPEIAGTVLGVAAIEGDAALFETYRQRFETTADPVERTRILGALGRFERPELARRVLDYVLAGPLRPHELRTIPFVVSFADDASRDRAFAWVRSHWSELVARMPPDRVPSMVRLAAGCSAERLAVGRDFFGAPERRQPVLDVQLSRVADQVGECVALRRREGMAVAASLEAAAAEKPARRQGRAISTSGR
jgi:alanyl aminopeptidase